MKGFTTRKIAFAGLFIALGLILPFLTGQIQSLGNKLLPMHLPILLCGFILGWPYGLVVGLITPILRSLLFGMPPMFPVAAAMAFELAVYGCSTGLLYRLLPRKNPLIYVNLIVSMIVGRIVWGLVTMVFFGIQGTPFTWSMFMTAAWINAVPGIILQLILIPLLIFAFEKSGLILNRSDRLQENSGV